MRKRRLVGRLGAVLILTGSAGLAAVPGAGAEDEAPTGSFTITARADTFAFEFVETAAPAAPGGEVFYATPSTAQSLLDSVGRSEGFAAAPSPGPFFATLPSNGNGVLAGFGFPFSFPDYPFYAASTHPVVPTSDRAFGPFRARAESDQYRALGDARSGGLTNDDPAFMSSRAAAAVRLDPDTKLRTAEASSRFDGFTSGPLALGQSTAAARMTQAPGEAPKKESSFTLGSFTIAGVQIAMTDKGFKLGDQAPPTADMSTLFGALAQGGITVEFLPARETETSIDSAGMRITRAGTDPSGTQHKVALVLGRVTTSIQGSSLPVISGTPTVVEEGPDPTQPTSAPVTTEPDLSSDAPATGGAGLVALPGSYAGAIPTDLPEPGEATTAVAPVLPATLPVTQLATPAVAVPDAGPDATSFYLALLVAGVLMTIGTRLVAALGVKAGAAAGSATEGPASVLRLPQR
jgi:hypothetical protein